VCVPTYQGAREVGRLLDAVLAQDPPPEEVIVVDSGSTDGTLAIVRARPGVRLLEISQAEFGHGRTRNFLAVSASGDVVLFLTQDAVPRPGWLGGLVEVFASHPDVVAAVGLQVPPPHCPPPVRYDIEATFAALGPRDRTTTWGAADRDRLGWRTTALSNSSCGYRCEVLLELPFPEVGFAEDQAFAAQALAAGHRLAYAPLAEVVHGHDLTFRQYWARQRAEASALRTATGWRPRPLVVLAGLAARDTATWAWSLLRDRDQPLRQRLAWLPRIPLYAVARRLAGWRAGSRRASEHRP